MKRYFILALILCGIICGFIGYHCGIHRATTGAGWIEDNYFVLEVNGNLYEWEISTE